MCFYEVVEGEVARLSQFSDTSFSLQLLRFMSIGIPRIGPTNECYVFDTTAFGKTEIPLQRSPGKIQIGL
jgi:hypothetical protein